MNIIISVVHFLQSAVSILCQYYCGLCVFSGLIGIILSSISVVKIETKQRVSMIRLHHKPLNEGEWKEVNLYKETFEVFMYFLAFLYLREHSIQFFN